MLKEHQDAMGALYWDYYHGNAGSMTVERGDGLMEAEAVSAAHYFSTCEQWSESERKGLELARGRVLDVGCGAGRHSLYLQEQGHEVIAIDESPLAIEVCRLRGVRDARMMTFAQAAYRLRGIDTVVMFGNNFGLFGGFKSARRKLSHLRRSTSPGARIIAQCTDPYATTNPVHLRYHESNRRRGRVSGQLRLRVHYKDRISPWFDYLLPSQDEVNSILDGAGWTLSSVLDLSGGRYIAVIERVD